MRPTLALALLVTVAGCKHYWVEERALDAYANLPQAQRKHVIVAATRASDGTATLIRAGEAAPEPVTQATRRRVRVVRPLTTTGIVFIATGIGLVAAGVGVLLTPADRSSGCQGNDACALGNGIVGIPLISIGGAELSIGLTMTGVGAGTTELRAPRPPRYELLTP